MVNWSPRACPKTFIYPTTSCGSNSKFKQHKSWRLAHNQFMKCRDQSLVYLKADFRFYVKSSQYRDSNLKSRTRERQSWAREANRKSRIICNPQTHAIFLFGMVEWKYYDSLNERVKTRHMYPIRLKQSRTRVYVCGMENCTPPPDCKTMVNTWELIRLRDFPIVHRFEE